MRSGNAVRGMVVLLTSALLLLLPGCSGESSLKVYVPASLANVMEEAAAQFEVQERVRVDTRIGGSGELAVEIENGAPADLYISAHSEWFERLRGKGLISDRDTGLLAWNRLVVVVPHGGTILPQSLSFIPTFKRIAVGDPDTVPAGRYAKQALENLGYWAEVQDRLVLTANVRGALALAERGEVDAALVYATDAKASQQVHFAFEIPEKTHDPIVYPAGVLTGSRQVEKARRFLQFMTGAEGKAILREHGFSGT